MAVHDRSYRSYPGPWTPRWQRLLVIPRYAFRELAASRLLLLALLASYVYPAIGSVLIYLRHNSEALAILGIDPKQLLAIGPGFFGPMLQAQCMCAFLLILAVGPSIMGSDLRNNALCLYLSRPIRRWEYVVGKFSVLAVVGSVVTWVPLLTLVIFQASLDGKPWLDEYGFLGPALFVGSFSWVVFMSVLAMTITAAVRFKPFARALMVGAIIALGMLGSMINGLLNVTWGTLLNPGGLFGVLWRHLLDRPEPSDLSPVLAWIAVGLMTLALLALLRLKLRAYEVVR